MQILYKNNKDKFKVLIILKNFKDPDSNIAISSDGVEIHYEIHGKGENTLIFVHGWCCDKSYWREQIPYFSKSYRIVLIDLAGHGESGLNRNSWAIEAFGDDVACVAKKLGTTKVVLIGHSMGGVVILEAATQLSNVLGIIGVDALSPSEYKPSQEEIEKRMSPFRKDFKNTMMNFIPNYLFLPSSDPTLVEKITEDMASVPPEIGIDAFLNTLKYHSTLTRFKELKLPIRIIKSSRSPINIRAGKRYVSSFEVKSMDNVGHFVMLEDPETFNNILDEILIEFF
jgi:pimeloyl-ACP methyl ester carboxylesterase